MSKEIPICNYYSGNSEVIDTDLSAILSAANNLPLRWPEEVRNSQIVDESNKGEAGNFVADNIKKNLDAGRTVVIEDGSHGLAYGINLSKGDSVEITRVDRFYSDKTKKSRIEKMIFQNPVFKTEFTEDNQFRLFIEGTENEEKKILEVASNGNFYPRPFLIASYVKFEYDVLIGNKFDQKILAGRKLLKLQNIILAKKDARGSFAGIWGHEGSIAWVVSRPASSI
ncbi:MAG: hypothetical protein M1268_01285 [Patescibacteria group bacterium]|nr:hypothetical protein [Patescibacteria group bacterium]